MTPPLLHINGNLKIPPLGMGTGKVRRIFCAYNEAWDELLRATT